MTEPTTAAGREYARSHYPEGPALNREYNAMRARELAALGDIEAEARAAAEAQIEKLRAALERLGRTIHEERRHGTPFEVCTWHLCTIAREALAATKDTDGR